MSESAILLVNSGSSSLKLTLCESNGGYEFGSAHCDWSGVSSKLELIQGASSKTSEVVYRDCASAIYGILPELLKSVPKDLTLAAVGHRIVHGGELSESAVVTEDLLLKLEKICELAPLHNPPGIAALREARSQLPNVPHVAIFDTAFHQNIPARASQYAIPRQWTHEWGIRRYGFHGLSHSYCLARSAEMLNVSKEKLRLIVCHLGHGCSATAIKGGQSVDTTMGFTPLEGLMMATRCGNIDAGAVLHVQKQHGLTADEILSILNQKSGILGVSEISADMREVIRRSEEGHGASSLAIDLYCYRLQQAIAALQVPLGGADAIVFTGGVGENSYLIRESVCSGLCFLGITLDLLKNKTAVPDCDISTESANCKILVISTKEHLAMFSEVKKLTGT